MRRWHRALTGGALALFMVGAAATPGAAAVAPQPLSQQWWFVRWGVQQHIWPHTQGQGVTVAVVDTGVQASIPELSGVVLPGTNADTGSGDGRTDVHKPDNPQHVPGHGTAMASLIAAQGRGTGFVGIAPGVKILPVVAETAAGQAKGIRYAADHGAKVINISQSAPGPCSPALQEAVGYAVQRDVVVVAGAGNEGATSNQTQHPANCAGVLAVGALNNKSIPWAGTQRQPYVAVAAPGVRMPSVLRDGKIYIAQAGTSSATALTSGAAALVRAKYPQMPAREVVRNIIASAKDVGKPGKDDQTGYGDIRPYRIFAGLNPKTSPNPVFDAYDQWAKNNPAAAGKTPAASGGTKSTPPDIGVIIGVSVSTIVVLGIIVMVLVRRKKPVPQGPPAGFPPNAPRSFGGPPPPPGQTPPGRPEFLPPADPAPRAPQGGPRPPQSFGPPQGGPQSGGRPPQSFGPPPGGPQN